MSLSSSAAANLRMTVYSMLKSSGGGYLTSSSSAGDGLEFRDLECVKNFLREDPFWARVFENGWCFFYSSKAENFDNIFQYLEIDWDDYSAESNCYSAYHRFQGDYYIVYVVNWDREEYVLFTDPLKEGVNGTCDYEDSVKLRQLYPHWSNVPRELLPDDEDLDEWWVNEPEEILDEILVDFCHAINE